MFIYLLILIVFVFSNKKFLSASLPYHVIPANLKGLLKQIFFKLHYIYYDLNELLINMVTFVTKYFTFHLIIFIALF